MSFYEGMAKTATNLITKFGKAVTFKRETGGTYDPVTGATTPPVVELFYPPGIWQTINAENIDGTLIQAGDRMVVIDASFAPEMTDKVLINSTYWNIVNISDKNPAGIPLAYNIQVRK